VCLCVRCGGAAESPLLLLVSVRWCSLVLLLVVAVSSAEEIPLQVVNVAFPVDQVLLVVVFVQLDPGEAPASQILRVVYVYYVLALLKVTSLHELLRVVKLTIVLVRMLLLQEFLLLEHIVELDLLACLRQIIVNLRHH
jgi:hypothetical protein